METILPSEFKRQMVLCWMALPMSSRNMHTSGTAQTRHKLHTRLRHLTTGRLIDRVFAENERVDRGAARNPPRDLQLPRADVRFH